MIICAKCGHRAHTGVCAECITEYEDDRRHHECVCMTPIPPVWVTEIAETASG